MFYYVNVVLCGVIFITFVTIICGKCGGKTSIDDLLNGTIILHHDRYYTSNTYCEWLIQAPQHGQKILLTFREFDTECSFDYLKVYDGSSKEKLLGSFSGNTRPSKLISNTSAIVLEFFSDNFYVRSGCVIDFLITDCPGNCSNHGSCIDNQCYCDELFTGSACDIEMCPDFCNNLTGNGQCSQSNDCHCQPDFIGQSCSFSLRDNATAGHWHLIKDYSPVFRARFAHAGVYVQKTFWIFGGSNLNKVFDDLVKFNFDDNKWQFVATAGDRPSARFRHTMVSYKDTLVVFGGELADGTLLNDLWIFNISTSTWKRLYGSENPPGLASHCATVHDDELILFGGQSDDYEFSNQMYTYDLFLLNGWKRITYKLGKLSYLRLIGHSCVFSTTLKSLIVFGGYRIVTGRRVKKVDTLLVYNVEGKVWFPITAPDGPKPTAYHSSVLMSDHMILYGGIVHTPHSDETCYGNDIYLLNLKKFNWTSIMSDSYNVLNISGRYSHVAAAVNQSTLMVVGGFSGIPSGDFLAYKIPFNIMHSDPNSSPMCHLFSQCVPCLTWGSQSDFQCGWCVQDSTCYELHSPSGPCSTNTTTRGWWGNEGSFLTSMSQCRIQDNTPGLLSNISYTIFENRLDDMRIINPLRETFPTISGISPLITSYVTVTWRGFIYPFISHPIDKPDSVSLVLRAGISESASVHLSTNERQIDKEKVISFNVKNEDLLILREAKRPDDLIPLFPNATVNKMYYIEVRARLPTQRRNLLLELIHDSDVIDGRLVRPFFSEDCAKYSSCLNCLSDMSCGWCPSSNSCLLKNSSLKCQHSSGEDIHLVLNVTYCDSCSLYIDCESCSKVNQCVWNEDRCDQIVGTNTKETQCPSSCQTHKNCGSCVKSKNCLWCEVKNKCVPVISLPAAFVYGQCSHYSDNNTKIGQCPSCSQQNECADCWKTVHCGWCGEFHNGSCFAGGYDAPDGGSCNQLVSSSAITNNYQSYNWSYAACPDENECITRRDCDKDAHCFDFVGSYRCECKQGYEGDGKFCKPLCSPRCVHGECIKHASNVSLDRCDCDLGWTGPVCSLDCQCNNHSTCHTGIGVCDDCQELTSGTNCQFCVPGSYGNAISVAGCKKCECHGHGDEQRGICDDTTGHCFCMNNTMGPHCDQCVPGLSGYPERGEGCYYPCKAHSILSNTINGILSSLPEPGQDYDPNNVSCLWIITTLTHSNDQVVYSNKLATGTVTFRMKDIAIDCQTDHIYIYDGMPNFELGDVKSSFNLLGSLCGSDSASIPVIESRSGSMVVVFKGNLGPNSLTKGFNASFVVNQCPDSCTGNRFCHRNGTHESCVCKPGWTGTACDDIICPANCSEGLGRGHCDQVSGHCVCENGSAGRSCDIQHPTDDFIWKYSSHMKGSSSTLARMGHTLIADDQTQSLIIFGGYSLYFGILGDIWRYDTKTENYAQENSWSTTPSPRYFHAAVVYKRTMYVTGGITDKGYSSAVWKYNLDTKQWQMGQALPRKLAGHTVNVINDTLYLIGGYSLKKQCSSNVYKLNLETISSEWSDLNPAGDKFEACFGHSTVYDHFNKSLVVFGKKDNKMKPTLAILKLTTNKWVVVSGVPEVRYFHVSLIVGNVMMVTTGYTGHSAQHLADQALVYDLRCGSWHRPDLKGLVPSSLAHSAIVSMNNVTYMFGGYNGLSSGNLYRQNISSNWCALFSTETSCSEITSCAWCRDNARNLAGCYVSDSHSHLNCSVANAFCQPGSFAMPMASALMSSGDACIGKSVPGGCSICIQDSTCSWLIDTQLCVSHSFQPITCAFGLCGRVLRSYDVCPALCNTNTYCYDCLERYNCGWCTNVSQNGRGVCTEGTLHGPYNGTCPEKNDVTTWASTVCLPENECLNGHHQCNENETCVNLDVSYRCECLPGFNRINGSCTPVCRQGCLYGSCINPDHCFCNFGWVGINCSTACKCNGKGHCINETQPDHCQDCRDHTTGRSCDRCLPGYVGQHGHCLSCSEKCYKNAQVCYDPTKQNTTEGNLFGPRDDDAIHCECSDKSEGNLCKNCKSGFFRSPDACIKCKCRGHSKICDRNSGTKCDCQNRTRSPENADSRNQCSQCENEYLGSPDIEGQQCYHKLTVLGPKSFAREFEIEKYLLPFQTSFFYILPSYTNINVRLTIDIFRGSLEVYISNGDNAFKVDPSQNVTISLPKISSPEVYTNGLNTYTTFSGGTQVIVLKQMKHRLVVTFPSEEHGLDNTKFYIILKAGNDGANGKIYFKQDNTKINLIVFFIVFTSCFVFLLSALSIVWSIKNHFHSRQEVHNLEVENTRRHNRPFSKFAFLFEYQPPAPSVIRHRKTTASTRKAIKPMGVECTSDLHATITTVIFQMPQTDKTKMTVSLGTTLALATPQQKDKLAQPSESKQTTNL